MRGRRTLLFFVLVFSWVGLTTAQLFACSLSYPTEMGFHLPQDAKSSGIFTPEGRRIEVMGCKPTAKIKYLMLAVGPDIINLNYQRGVSYNGYYHDDYCRLESDLLDPSLVLDHETKLQHYKEKTDFVHRCLQYRVKDDGPRGLNFPVDQKGCTTTRIDRQHAVMKGGFCFIKIQAQSNFSIKAEVSPDCRGGSKELPQDVHATTGVFTAGDASGHSVDLEHLALIPTRLVNSPRPSAPGLSTNFGPDLPRWPSAMAPDIHFAGLKIDYGLDFPELTFNYLVDNNCQQICHEGECYSPCEFSVPVASENQLFQLNADGKKSLVSMGYFGGAVPGRWQGIMPSQSMQIGMDPFEKPGSFELKMKFAFPDTYYRLAGQNLRQFLVTRLSLDYKAGISATPSLNPLKPLKQLASKLPNVKGLPDLRQSFGHSEETDFSHPLSTLAAYLDFVSWPPYYEKICHRDLDKCEPAFENSSSTTIDVRFQVDAEKNIIIQDVKRKSNILKDYSTSSLPRVVCD